MKHLFRLFTDLLFGLPMAARGRGASRPTARGRAGAGGTATATPPADRILLTIFLRHDQSKTLAEIQAQLKKSGFWKRLPPPGVDVVSWYVMMGIGQVVTLSVPPAKLREVNMAIEQTAWKSFHTEFYPTYDFVPVWKELSGRK